MNISIFNFFFSLSTNPVIAWSSLFISNFLIYVFILAAIIIPLIYRRDYVYAVLTAGTGAAAFIFVYIVKNIFIIPRPYIAFHLTPLVLDGGYSFPSSHVTVIMALTILVWKVNRKWGIVFLIFTILTAFSRMIIGVHYPIDVFAGACFGVVIGSTSIWLNKFIKRFPIIEKYR